VVPLGYQVRDKKLLVNQEEARTVRMIFERYLALGSLPAVQRELRAQGIVTRKRTLSSGKVIGGVHLTNGPLAYMLRNRVYLGEINHRDQSYPGEHQPIVDPALFGQVQARLDENLRGRRLKNERSQALLLGKLYDDRGNRMTPSYAIKKGVRYRYYVSCVLAQGRKEEAGSISRVAASELETIVMDALATLVPASEESAESDRHGPATSDDRPLPNTPERVEGRPEQFSDKASVERYVDRIIVAARSIEVRFVEGAQAAAQSSSITIPWQPVPFRRKRELIQPVDGARPIRAEAQGRLLAAIARGRSWLEEISSDPATRLELIAAREGLPERSARSILSLAFLAPDIVKAAVTGTLSRGFGLSRLIDLPANWAEQRRALGLSARS
jgi:site-specific DNA recombinase